jgi:hypothetical protein
MFRLEPIFSLPILLACAAVLLCDCCARSDTPLVDFAKPFEVADIPARDVTLAKSGTAGTPALTVATGHTQPWPGIDLKPAADHWDLAAFEYVALDLRNTGKDAVTVHCRVDNPGADGVNNCLNGSLDLAPGGKGTLTVPLKRRPTALAGVKLFGMRGYPEGAGGGTDFIDPANVVGLVVFVDHPTADHLFEINSVRAGGAYVAPPEATMDAAHFFPFIDEFGQYIHRDWPGKTHSVADFAKRLEAEEKDLRAKSGPEDWDTWGGWKAGPTLKATGFFRVEKYEGKWWLVDPDGKLYWSHGTDCVNPWEGGTPIDDRDKWFRDLPGPNTQFGECYGQAGYVVNGYYTGRNPRTFDFARANLIRKYGPQYQARFADISQRRLRSWGMNTIANWSDAGIYLMHRTPYTATLGTGGKMLENSQGYWAKFRDVFDPSFAQETRANIAGQRNTTAEDPWCIGYFVDNELAWGDDLSLAAAALLSPPQQVAKQVFIADLKAKYVTIEKLNEAWGTDHASWDALLQSRSAPDAHKAGADLRAFYTKTAETYFRTIRDAVKEVAPNHLYLGCRFAWVNTLAAEAAAKYCDVVSYNLYQHSIADFRFPGKADVPLIVGEFHFGALDRGMFHTGLVPTASQAARAQAYRDYVQGALRNPAFVGTGWFKYMDEATTGRPLDEENYQIGLVDCCDTPYPETIAAVREVGYGMYPLRLGRAH